MTPLRTVVGNIVKTITRKLTSVSRVQSNYQINGLSSIIARAMPEVITLAWVECSQTSGRR